MKPLESLTLADMQSCRELIPDLAAIADIHLAKTYGEFVDVLYRDIDTSIKNIESDSGLYADVGEDLLTAQVLIFLKARGYNATHDEKYGGHSDLVVRSRYGYVWLGEAKIHKDYEYLQKGFNQLCTRYADGTPDCSKGGLIIYIKTKDAKSVIDTWKGRLKSQNLPEYEDSADCPSRRRGPLAFISTHKHDRSGLMYEVRHIAVVMGFDPKDRKH